MYPISEISDSESSNDTILMTFLKFKNQHMNNVSSGTEREYRIFIQLVKEGLPHATGCDKNMTYPILLKGHVTALFHFYGICASNFT